MKLFVASQTCVSEEHCKTCRNLEGGRRLREGWAKHFAMPEGGVDFECPTERGAKPWGYVPAPKPPRPKVDRKPGTKPVADDNWGPRLWGLLHGRYRLWTGAEAERAWLAYFRMMVPCGQCRADWDKLVKDHPPDLSSPENYWLWTVKLHNLVSQRLGKPQLSVEDARRIWPM